MRDMRTLNNSALDGPLKQAKLGDAMTSTAQSQAGVSPVNLAYVTQPRGVGRLGLWFLRLVGQVRRQYLSRLRPGYVQRLKAERQGACRRCGSCCDLTFYCPYLSAESGCLHYEKRTLTCRDFPIDALDLKLTRVPCGHYFAAPPEDGARANSSG